MDIDTLRQIERRLQKLNDMFAICIGTILIIIAGTILAAIFPHYTFIVVVTAWFSAVAERRLTLIKRAEREKEKTP